MTETTIQIPIRVYFGSSTPKPKITIIDVYVYDGNGSFTQINNSTVDYTDAYNFYFGVKMPFTSSYAGRLLRIQYTVTY